METLLFFLQHLWTLVRCAPKFRDSGNQVALEPPPSKNKYFDQEMVWSYVTIIMYLCNNL